MIDGILRTPIMKECLRAFVASRSDILLLGCMRRSRPEFVMQLNTGFAFIACYGNASKVCMKLHIPLENTLSLGKQPCFQPSASIS